MKKDDDYDEEQPCPEEAEEEQEEPKDDAPKEDAKEEVKEPELPIPKAEKVWISRTSSSKNIVVLALYKHATREGIW